MNVSIESMLHARRLWKIWLQPLSRLAKFLSSAVWPWRLKKNEQWRDNDRTALAIRRLAFEIGILQIWYELLHYFGQITTLICVDGKLKNYTELLVHYFVKNVLKIRLFNKKSGVIFMSRIYVNVLFTFMIKYTLDRCNLPAFSTWFSKCV